MASKSIKKMPPKRKAAKSNGTAKTLLSQFAKLTFAAQEVVLKDLGDLYATAKRSRAVALLAELRSLGIKTSSAAVRGKASSSSKRAHGLAGKKVAAKYRSRKDASQTWSGRGATPRWMTAEMKGTKLKKADFEI